MNNKKLTKKSKWLKLALISTAAVSTLATIPAAICAKPANSKTKKARIPSNQTAAWNSSLEAIGYVQIVFKLRETDKSAQATITGQTVAKIKKGGRFGSIMHPKAVKPGYKFLGWSRSDDVTQKDVIPATEVISKDETLFAVFANIQEIVIEGREIISTTEPVQYKHKVFPESTSQEVKWYVCDDLTKPQDGSDYATVDETTGIVTAGKELGDFYLYAIAKDAPLPTTLTGDETYVLKINVTNPWHDPEYAKYIIVEVGDREAYYAVDPAHFYPQHGSSITGTKIGTTDETTWYKNMFDLPIYVGDDITVINDSFLENFSALENYPIHLPDGLTHIGSFFFNDNTVFKSSINLPVELRYIGDCFMAGCTQFNSPDVEFNCRALTYIGDDFLRGCSSYKQGMTLPTTLTHVGENFMFNCASGNNVVVSCPVDVFEDSEGTFAGDDEDLNHQTNVCCTQEGSEITFKELQGKFNDYKGKTLSRQLVEEALPWTVNQAFIKDENGLHACSDLFDCHICTETPDTDTMIIADDGTEWARAGFNEEIYLHPQLTHIQAGFLNGCANFDKPFIIPNSVNIIGIDFLLGCAKFNQALTLPSGITTIQNNFMSGCAKFNKSITIPDNVSNINAGFLSGCKAFNQPLTIPATVDGTIGGSFLYQCDSMISPINIKCSYQVFTADSQSFATDEQNAPCYTQGFGIDGLSSAAFDSFAANFPDSDVVPYRKLIKTPIPWAGQQGCIEDNDGSRYFINNLTDAGIFNKDADIVAGDATHNKTFPRATFNSRIYLNPNLIWSGISANFLINCPEFNQPITIPAPTQTIGSDFLSGCKKFNQSLTIPNTVITIGDNFLSGCEAFDKELILPEGLKTINSGFLSGCKKFNKKLTLPNSITTIGTEFMFDCDLMQQSLLIGCPITVFKNSDKSFATDNPEAPVYKTGFLIDGIDDAQFMELHQQFPDRPLGQEAPFRKLINNVIPWDDNLACIKTKDGKFHMIKDLKESGLCSEEKDRQIVSHDMRWNNNEFNEKIYFNWEKIQSIPDFFLANCVSFNQDLIISDQLPDKSIGKSFMFNCDAMTSKLIFFGKHCIEQFTLTDPQSFATENGSAACIKTGIQIYGLTEEAFNHFISKEYFPLSLKEPPFRNLIRSK